MQDFEWFQRPTRKRTDCFKTVVSGSREAALAWQEGKLLVKKRLCISIMQTDTLVVLLVAVELEIWQHPDSLELYKKSYLNEIECMHMHDCYYIQWV